MAAAAPSDATQFFQKLREIDGDLVVKGQGGWARVDHRTLELVEVVPN